MNVALIVIDTADALRDRTMDLKSAEKLFAEGKLIELRDIDTRFRSFAMPGPNGTPLSQEVLEQTREWKYAMRDRVK